VRSVVAPPPRFAGPHGGALLASSMVWGAMLLLRERKSPAPLRRSAIWLRGGSKGFRGVILSASEDVSGNEPAVSRVCKADPGPPG
jgi:hypothetical protein